MNKPKKRTAKKPKTEYKPVFTSEEFKLIQAYGVGTLLDEIGLNRVMLLRFMHKMNQEMEHLSFRDHIDALRAVAYTTGHITRQTAVRERLYKPYEEIEKQYLEYGEKIQDLLDDVGLAIYGDETWGDMLMQGLRRKLDEHTRQEERKSGK